jgi:hypothetical protein
LVRFILRRATRRASKDALRQHGDTFRIVQKRVDLINCDGAFEAVAVPI